MQRKVCCLSFLSSPVRTVSGQRSPQDDLQPTVPLLRISVSSEVESPGLTASYPWCFLLWFLSFFPPLFFEMWSLHASQPRLTPEVFLLASQELNITAAHLRHLTHGVTVRLYSYVVSRSSTYKNKGVR